jgi:biopolymer transport protein ExbD
MSKRTREKSILDMTPLIDVVFLLLIFFLVSTVIKKDEMALLLDLPSTEHAQSAQANSSDTKKLLIELAEEKLAINGKAIATDAIEAGLKAITNKKIGVELRVDKDVRYQSLVGVLDLLKKYNLNNLELVTSGQGN